MKTWTPETLSERVCKRGHKGDWAIRGVVNQSVACRTCAKEALKRHHENNPTKVKKATRNKTLPNVGQIERLKAYIFQLETQLEVAKKRLEVSEEMLRLHEELKNLKKIG